MVSAQSAKRGIAYDLQSYADVSALSSGVSWWYNWAATPDYNGDTQGMDYIPMLWNDNFDDNAVVSWLQANPNVQYLLLLNEPNLVEQSNKWPDEAARIWPRYEAIADQTGVQLVGPAITWGTMPGYQVALGIVVTENYTVMSQAGESRH